MIPKYLIFDFDGTIADTEAGIIGTVQATLAALGLPPADPAAVKASIGLPLSGSLRASGVPEEMLEAGDRAYHELFMKMAPAHIVLFPDMKETLSGLCDSGYVLAIATSRGRDSLGKLLESHGIRQYFSVLGTVECAPVPKPAPDTVLYVLDRLGASPEESAVIGDTAFDIEMGRRAGCRTCGVTYGNHDRVRLEAAGADWIIDSIKELPRLLKQLI